MTPFASLGVELMMIANSLRSIWTRLSAVTAVMLAAVVAPVGAASIEETLSKNTLLFARITNAKGLREAFEQTQFGRLIEDPALKPIRADVAKNLEKFSADVKSAAGVTLSELLTLPTGPMHIAVVPGSNEKVPVGFYASLDAGDKASAFTDAMSKLIKFGTDQRRRRQVDHHDICLGQNRHRFPPWDFRRSPQGRDQRLWC
jgi:hypothetical protein